MGNLEALSEQVRDELDETGGIDDPFFRKVLPPSGGVPEVSFATSQPPKPKTWPEMRAQWRSSKPFLPDFEPDTQHIATGTAADALAKVFSYPGKCSSDWRMCKGDQGLPEAPDKILQKPPPSRTNSDD